MIRNRVEVIGVRPEDRFGRNNSYPIIHCDACGAAIVWAWDDMFPEDESPLLRRQFNFEPVAAKDGDAVLWYAINDSGDPIGRQEFRRMAQVELNYSGDAWSFHSGTCSRKLVRPCTPSLK